MHLTLMINEVVSVLGVIIGLLFAGASIISIANMTAPGRGLLIPAAFLVPIAFAVSGIGAPMAYGHGLPQLFIGLVALPWVYGLIFVLLMVASFKK